MNTVTLLTGGSRSGKSRHALDISAGYDRKIFIATAEPLDDEMRIRISRHKEERGSEYMTVEEPVDLAGALRSLPPGADVAIIDCLTVWIGNLMYRYGNECECFQQVEDFLALLKEPPCDLIIVTNELGMGIIPDNPLSRKFRDLAGNLNMKTAAAAGRVLFLICGIPIIIKDGEKR